MLDAGDFSKTFWVLFADAEEFPKVNDEFRRVSAAIEAWGDDVPADLKVSYKRAYLAFSAKQIGVTNR
jgi:hypothetical protein